MYVKHTKPYPHVHDCRLTTWTWATYQGAHNWRKQSPLNSQKQTGMLADMHGLVQVLCMSLKVHECKNPVTSFAVFFPAWSSFLWIVSSLTKTLSLGLNSSHLLHRLFCHSVFLYMVNPSSMFDFFQVLKLAEFSLELYPLIHSTHIYSLDFKYQTITYDLLNLHPSPK